MRWFALVGLVGLLSGCGPEVEQAPAAGEAPRTEQGPPESWCRSYKSKQYCPSVCAWHSTPAPGYCGLKSES